MISVFGISTGCLVHTLAAAFGLSAIMAASSYAFVTIKFIGAAYLMYLGVRMFFDGAAGDKRITDPPAPASGWIIFRQGIQTNVLNPKVAIFFLAFLPQFIDVHSSSKVLPFIILGLTFIFNGTLWCMIVAWFASAFSRRFRERPSTGSWLKGAASVLFVGLGLKLAIEKL